MKLDDEYEASMEVQEVDLGFDEEQPEKESSRCLNVAAEYRRWLGTGLASIRQCERVV